MPACEARPQLSKRRWATRRATPRLSAYRSTPKDASPTTRSQGAVRCLDMFDAVTNPSNDLGGRAEYIGNHQSQGDFGWHRSASLEEEVRATRSQGAFAEQQPISIMTGPLRGALDKIVFHGIAGDVDKLGNHSG